MSRLGNRRRLDILRVNDNVQRTERRRRMPDPSLYPDPFARDHLPARGLWPDLSAAMSGRYAYSKVMNATAELLDRAVAQGHGARYSLHAAEGSWTYAQLLDAVNRIANVLVRDLGLVPGNRVLLRAPNNPMLAACWLAVVKAGGIVVATMPLLRAAELGHMLDKARIRLALCDARLVEALDEACAARAHVRTVRFGTDAADGLEARMAQQSGDFAPFMASHDDVALIAFTSGTTGSAKATMHFHRDLIASCDAFAGPVLKAAPHDVFAGSAPFAFTFGLGALLLFPLRFAASAVLLEKAMPESLLEAMARHRATIAFTVPTLYRAMTPLAGNHDLASLRTCVSSGEHLPPSVYEGWRQATGLTLMNSIGSTEMLHAFLAMPPGEDRPNAVGRPLPGFSAMVVDDAMKEVPPGQIGRLAVRGPTGCRYLGDDERQKTYVRAGWNLTGDAFYADADGYFCYHARTDDMIVSAGYNISGAEVEEALLQHPAVRECAVVGTPDPARGHIVAAFVILHDPQTGNDEQRRALQDFVKSRLAPYKYPRIVEFLDALPRTSSGKIQRHVLRARSEGVA
ncbi:MAG: 2-aminobenzoate-CoA ligase [Alphaproteobacteria bacterium]|nr:MAG: 2-aminobenzoate-CoA ligase [Alphaproteobacteria bacterium]